MGNVIVVVLAFLLSALLRTLVTAFGAWLVLHGLHLLGLMPAVHGTFWSYMALAFGLSLLISSVEAKVTAG